MFVLRDAILHALDEESYDLFVERVAKFLREALPGPTRRYGTAELAAWIRETRERAATYDIHSERGVASFACLRMLVGDMDRVPATHQFLSMPSELSPDDRAILLLKKSCQKSLQSWADGPGGT